MAIYQLPTGTYETRAAFAFTGGSFRDKRAFAATAILVTHPRGDFLIDAGFGSGIAAHVHAQPWFARAPFKAAATASEQLDASGYDRSRLRGVLITHSHWDHVSGLDQLPVPIWTNAGELQYAGEARDGRVFRTVSKGHEIHRYEFGNVPYLGFPSSYDVHGDGSVVVALAGGYARTCSGSLRWRVSCRSCPPTTSVPTTGYRCCPPGQLRWRSARPLRQSVYCC
jgi:N-acyl homoserine lactone hydrolase